jgi:hypothetical protein
MHVCKSVHGINWVCIVHSLPKIFGERYGDFSSRYGPKLGPVLLHQLLEGAQHP